MESGIRRYVSRWREGGTKRDRGIEYNERGRASAGRNWNVARKLNGEVFSLAFVRHDSAGAGSSRPHAEMEASLVNWKSYKSVRRFSRHEADAVSWLSASRPRLPSLFFLASCTKAKDEDFFFLWKHIAAYLQFLWETHFFQQTIFYPMYWRFLYRVEYFCSIPPSQFCSVKRIWKLDDLPVAKFMHIGYASGSRVCRLTRSAVPSTPFALGANLTRGRGVALRYVTLNYLEACSVCGACYREAAPVIRCIYTGIYRRAITPL